MAENMADIDSAADIDVTADISQANQADLFENTLETAYGKIMDAISDGDFEGSNAELLEKSGIRDVLGPENSDTVSVRLVTEDGVGSSYYKEVLEDNWDGKSPILVVDSGGPNGEVAAVPAQELYDFVHDDSRNDKLSQDSGEGGDITRHQVNYMDGVTDSYRTTVETEDGKSVEICTDLVETLDGYQWETMAFTYDEDGNRVSLEETCCDRCDRSEDPTAMHESAVEYMKEYSGDFVDLREDSGDSADTKDDRSLIDRIEDAANAVIEKISSAVSEIIGGLIEELQSDVSNDDDKMDAAAENEARDTVEPEGHQEEQDLDNPIDIADDNTSSDSKDIDEDSAKDIEDENTPLNLTDIDDDDTDDDQDNLNDDDDDDWGDDSVD